MTNGNSAQRFAEWAADYGFTDEQTEVHQYALQVSRDAWDKAMSVCADGGKSEAVRRDAIYRKALAMGDAPDVIGVAHLVAPQAECAPREAQPIGKVLSDAEMGITFDRSKCGNVVWFNTPQPGFIYAAPTPERAQPLPWVSLTDEDRQQAFESLPDMLEGFLKKWGWLNFAKEIERRCMEKNAPERAQESAGVRMSDDQIREIWMRETGTTEQDSPLAILDFARAVLADNKEPQP